MKTKNMAIFTSIIIIMIACETKYDNILEMDFRMDFDRNDTTLVSEFRITGFNVDENGKNCIQNSLFFIPDFEYEFIWISENIELNRDVDNINYWGVGGDNYISVIIKPSVILEELTKYQVYIGDDKIIKRQSLSFITGPYSFLTTDCIIEPQYWLTRDNFRLNADGILETYYSGLGWQGNFVNSAQYALFCYEDYIRNQNIESKNTFMGQVEYFCSNYNMINGNIAYPYQFPYRTLPAGWYSGMAQGHVVSVLVRAFILTNDDYYLDFAKKVINFMFIPVEQGGVFTHTPEGYEWIEEYPTTPPSFVWNGFVFALMGLIDYNKICPSEELSLHIDRFITAIKNTIDIYDTGSQLLYGRGSWAGINDLRYLGVQTHQCLHMYEATKDPFFYDLYLKWNKYFDYNAFMAIYD
jgi:hypothetical protein